MSEADRAAVDVELLPVPVAHLFTGKQPGGETLVALDQVEVVDRLCGAVERGIERNDTRVAPRS